MIKHANDLTLATQAFVDGLKLDRPPAAEHSLGYSQDASDKPLLSPALLRLSVFKLDPDMPRKDWFRIAAVLFYETRGGEEGYEIFDAWSATGTKYKGTKETRGTWKGIRPDFGRPATLGSLRYMLRAAGHNWFDILAEADEAAREVAQ